MPTLSADDTGRQRVKSIMLVEYLQRKADLQYYACIYGIMFVVYLQRKANLQAYSDSHLVSHEEQPGIVSIPAKCCSIVGQTVIVEN